MGGKGRCRFVLLVWICVGIAKLCFGQSNHEILDFLARENEASRSQISKIEYRATYTTTSDIIPSSHVVRVCTAHIIDQDHLRYTELNQMTRLAGKADSHVISRSVLNDNYWGSYPDTNAANAYRYDHISISQMNSKVITHRATDEPPDLMRFAMDANDQSLADEIEVMKAAHGISWSVDPPNTNTPRFFNIRETRTGKSGQKLPWTNRVIDAEQGFLVTHCEIYNFEGELGIVVDVKETLLADGKTWVPKEATKTMYKRWLGNSNEVDTRPGNTIVFVNKLVFDSVKINPQVPNTQFQFSALGVPNGRTVIVTDASGSSHIALEEDGTVIPFEIAARLSDQANVAANPLPDKQKSDVSVGDLNAIATDNSRKVATGTYNMRVVYLTCAILGVTILIIVVSINEKKGGSSK